MALAEQREFQETFLTLAQTRSDPPRAITSADLNAHLMHAVLCAALFFETSNDTECDPDLR